MIADQDDDAEGGSRQQTTHLSGQRVAYHTRAALEHAKQLRDGGFALTCVLPAARIRPSQYIDICNPRARWRNNNLSNLLPTLGNINLSKSDRLPSSGDMADALGRLFD